MPTIVIDPGHGGATATGGSSANNATGPNGLPIVQQQAAPATRSDK